MTTCNCATFEDIEFRRDAVARRIKETRVLVRRLEVLASDASDEHCLSRCPDCMQLWQLSRAWNWGNDQYAYRVPLIDTDDWKEQPFVQPDELLIYAAVIGDLPKPEITDNACQESGCSATAIRFSVYCQRHHLLQLQTAGRLPKYPAGRWFKPYMAFDA